MQSTSSCKLLHILEGYFNNKIDIDLEFKNQQTKLSI